MNVDKTIKGHGRKVAAREKVDDGKAASKGGTTKAKPSKKAQRRKVDDGKAASNGGTTKAKPSKKVTAKKAVAPKPIQKLSAKTTKKTAKEASAKGKGSENVSIEKAGSNNFQKKTSPGIEKGKVGVMERNASDDNSLDLDNMEGMSEVMAKIRKEDRAKKPLVISVSPALANVANGRTKYVCSFPRPSKIVYAKYPYFRRVITMANKKQKLLNPDEDSTWVETISSFNLRAKDFGEASIWLKTSSGNTIDVMYFVHSVPIGEEHAFLPTLKAEIKYFFDITRKRKTNATGRLALDYCQDLPQGRKGGLGGYCLKKDTTKRALPKKWCLKIRQRMS